MGPKRFKNKLIILQYIKISNQNKLKWNFGANYKNMTKLKNLR